MTAQACMMTWLAGNMPCIKHAAAKRHPRITPVPACQTALPKRTAEHHGMFMAQVHKCAAASVGQMTDREHECCTAHYSPSAAHLACDLSHTGANRGLATILVAQRSSCPTCQAQTMHNPPYASKVAALKHMHARRIRSLCAAMPRCFQHHSRWPLRQVHLPTICKAHLSHQHLSKGAGKAGRRF